MIKHPPSAIIPPTSHPKLIFFQTSSFFTNWQL